MDALIHERAAAVEGEGAVPAVGVVGGGTLPLHVGAGEAEAAQPTGGDRGFHRTGAGAETGLKDGHQLHARGGGSGEEFVDAGQGDLDGFFDDQVFAGAGGGERGFEVGAAGSGDAHHIEARVGEKGGEIGGGKGGTVLGGEGFGLVRRATADGNESGTGGSGDGSCMKVGDQTESQDTEAERCGRGHVCQRLGMTGESDSFF